MPFPVNTVAFLLEYPVFTTRRYAVLCDTRIDVASRQLARLARQTALVRVTRGVWSQPGHPRFTPYGVAPWLLGNEQGYVSFLAALHLHGLISQIPGSIQVATTGHTRCLETPFARYEFLRIQPSMMVEGFGTSGTEPPYFIASAAKALLDTLYIATRKGRRFASLPEVTIGRATASELHRLLRRQVRAAPIRRAIETRLESLTGGSDAVA